MIYGPKAYLVEFGTAVRRRSGRCQCSRIMQSSAARATSVIKSS
jgi:hypothetical protein